MAKGKLITPEVFSGSFAVSKERMLLHCDCSHLAAEKSAILNHMIKASEDVLGAPVFVQTNDRFIVLDSSISIEKAGEMYDAKYTALEAASDALTIAKFEQKGWNEQRLVELMKREKFIQTQPPHEVRIDERAPHDRPVPPMRG